MGVLQRFERRLGGLVEGTFARVFGGYVQPVEVAAALTREAQDKKAIVGAGRVLVPNVYIVELGESDTERLGEYDEPLRRELAAMVSESATEQGWSFVGPVEVQLERTPALGTGVFRVRSRVSADAVASPAAADPPSSRPRVSPPPAGRPSYAGTAVPQLLVMAPGATGGEPSRTVTLTSSVSVIGRGAEADVQLTDTGVSRRHAEVHLSDPPEVIDLGSTNGTRLNDRAVSRGVLRDGDRIGVGTSVLVFRAGDASAGGQP